MFSIVYFKILVVLCILMSLYFLIINHVNQDIWYVMDIKKGGLTDYGFHGRF